MALSNWDTLAVDENGNATNGAFAAPKGASCEIYKNWLVVLPQGREDSDTRIAVTEGVLSVDGLRIRAKRGPQNGIFVVVQHTEWPALVDEASRLPLSATPTGEAEPTVMSQLLGGGSE